jgi:hypothetical protein
MGEEATGPVMAAEAEATGPATDRDAALAEEEEEAAGGGGDD